MRVIIYGIVYTRWLKDRVSSDGRSAGIDDITHQDRLKQGIDPLPDTLTCRCHMLCLVLEEASRFAEEFKGANTCRVSAFLRFHNQPIQHMIPALRR
jgi:hypothetical protein